MVIENHFLQLLLLLIIILPAAKLAGLVAIRLGQPSVLGELIIGILLGPSLINLMHLPIFGDYKSLAETTHKLAEIGVLLLMFIAGLELHIDELRRTGKVAAFAGSLGVIVPIALGWGVGLIFGLNQEAAFFLGLTLGATSVSISAQTLMEMKVLRSRVGLGLLGSAVFDDVLVILLLSIFSGLVGGSGSITEILWVIARMIIFLSASIAFGILILPTIIRVVRKLPISQNVLTLAIVVMLGYGLAAELIGSMAAITGAFLAGLMFSRSSEKETIMPRISALAYGFFVPIFFINIGLETDLSSVLSVAWMAIVIIIVAILGKLLGSGLGAKLANYSWLESAQLGTGMVSRGEVGLILAAVGEQLGVMSESTFSAIVAMIIVTTLITPISLRYLFSERFKPTEQKLTEEITR